MSLVWDSKSQDPVAEWPISDAMQFFVYISICPFLGYMVSAEYMNLLSL